MNYKKMSCAEIRARVDSGAIDLNSLSRRELQIIFDKEMEAQTRHGEYDTTLLNQCSEAFARLDEKKFQGFWNRKYTADDFYAMSRGTYTAAEETDSHEARSLPVRRRFVIAAIAAIIAVGMLGVGVAAYFNPFSIFGVSIKDLFNMRGDEVTGDNSHLYISISDMEFSSIEELSDAVGVYILRPSDDTAYETSMISFSEYDGFNNVIIQMKIKGYPEIVWNIYYGDKVDELYNEEVIASEYEANDWNGFNLYHAKYEDKAQAMLYYGDAVYVFVSDTREDIEYYLSTLVPE